MKAKWGLVTILATGISASIESKQGRAGVCDCFIDTQQKSMVAGHEILHLLSNIQLVTD